MKLLIALLIASSAFAQSRIPTKPVPAANPAKSEPAPAISDKDKADWRDAIKDVSIATLQANFTDAQIQLWLAGEVQVQDPRQILGFPRLHQQQKRAMDDARTKLSQFEAKMVADYKVDQAKFRIDESSLGFLPILQSAKAK